MSKQSLSIKERARRYVQAMDPAISHANGHGQAFHVAMVLVQDFALTENEALDVMREYSPRCTPPWTEDEIEHKVKDARGKIDPAKLGRKAGNGHHSRDDDRDPIEHWASLRAFLSAHPPRAMGARVSGNCVAFPLFVDGEEVSVVLRHADGLFFNNGKKAHFPKGKPKGLLLSEAVRVGIPADATIYIAEGAPNACALVDAGAMYVIGWPDAPGPDYLWPEIQRLLNGHRGRVVFFGDSGKAGVALVNRAGKALQAVGVQMHYKPGHPTKDFDELLRLSDDRAAALAKLDAGALLWIESKPDLDAHVNDEYSRPGHRPLTDLGNAERFADQHQGKILFDTRIGRWRFWDGRRWRLDDTGEVMRLAHKTARSVYREAASATDSKQADALAGHARRSEGRDRLKAMIDLAQPLLTIQPGEWDADGWLLNANNGSIDLHTGALQPHNPEDHITRLAPVDYDPLATSELWVKVLHDALDSPGDIEFLQRAAGYSATADQREEKLFLPIGPEASCKSTIFESVKAALGEYAATANFDSFIRKQGGGDGPKNDIARLQGARFVAAIEGDEGIALADGLIKSLTGGDRITARFLYRESFEFTPSFKIWLVTNHPPRVRDDDGAMWRRIVRIPFERQIPKDQRDPTIKARLKDPKDGGPAVLAWIVRGCLAWQAQGLGVPPSVERATENYREEQDPLRGFFEEYCRFDPMARVLAKDLRTGYEEWAKAEGVQSRYLVSPKGFAERIKARGCTPIYFNRARGWQGVDLVAATDSNACNTSSGNFSYAREFHKKVTENDVTSVASVVGDLFEGEQERDEMPF